MNENMIKYVFLIISVTDFKIFVRGLSKKYPTLFSPTVSNGKRVEKLSAVVEGTFMHMHDLCYLSTPLDVSVASR
jgi:hypothetical protein